MQLLVLKWTKRSTVIFLTDRNSYKWEKNTSRLNTEHTLTVLTAPPTLSSTDLNMSELLQQKNNIQQWLCIWHNQTLASESRCKGSIHQESDGGRRKDEARPLDSGQVWCFVLPSVLWHGSVAKAHPTLFHWSQRLSFATGGGRWHKLELADAESPWKTAIKWKKW